MLGWLSTVAQRVASATQSAAASLTPPQASTVPPLPALDSTTSFASLWQRVRTCHSERRVDPSPLIATEALVVLITRLVDALRREVHATQEDFDRRADAVSLLDASSAPASLIPHGNEDYVRLGPCLQALLELRVVEELCAIGARDEPRGMTALALRAVDSIIRLQPHTLLPLLHEPVNDLVFAATAASCSPGSSMQPSSAGAAARSRHGISLGIHTPEAADVAAVRLCHTVWLALGDNPSLLACFARPAPPLSEGGVIHGDAGDGPDVPVLGPVLAWAAAPPGSECGDAARDALLIAASIVEGADGDDAAGAEAIRTYLLRASRNGASLVVPVVDLFSRALVAADTCAAAQGLWACDGGVNDGASEPLDADAADDRPESSSVAIGPSSGAALVDAAAAHACFLSALVHTAAAVDGLHARAEPRLSCLAAGVIAQAAWRLCEKGLAAALSGSEGDERSATSGTLCIARLLRGLGMQTPRVPGAGSVSRAAPLHHLVICGLLGTAPSTPVTAQVFKGGGGTALGAARLPPCMEGAESVPEGAGSTGESTGERASPSPRSLILARILAGPDPLAAATLNLCAQLLGSCDHETLSAALSPLSLSLSSQLGETALPSCAQARSPVSSYYAAALRRLLVVLHDAAARGVLAGEAAAAVPSSAVPAGRPSTYARWVATTAAPADAMAAQLDDAPPAEARLDETQPATGSATGPANSDSNVPVTTDASSSDPSRFCASGSESYTGTGSAGAFAIATTSAPSLADTALGWVGLGAGRALRSSVAVSGVLQREAAAQVVAALTAEQVWLDSCSHTSEGPGGDIAGPLEVGPVASAPACGEGGVGGAAARHQKPALVDALLARAASLLDAPLSVALPLTQCLTALVRCPFPAVIQYLLDPGEGASGAAAQPGLPPRKADAAPVDVAVEACQPLRPGPGRLFSVVAMLWYDAHRRLAATVPSAAAAEVLIERVRRMHQPGGQHTHGAATQSNGDAGAGGSPLPLRQATEANIGGGTAARAAASAYVLLQEWTCELLATLHVRASVVEGAPQLSAYQRTASP